MKLAQSSSCSRGGKFTQHRKCKKKHFKDKRQQNHVATNTKNIFFDYSGGGGAFVLEIDLVFEKMQYKLSNYQITKIVDFYFFIHSYAWLAGVR